VAGTDEVFLKLLEEFEDQDYLNRCLDAFGLNRDSFKPSVAKHENPENHTKIREPNTYSALEQDYETKLT
jgi:hypothetical protein